MFKSLNLRVFLPPFLLLLVSSVLSMAYEASFLTQVNHLNAWILQHFDWLFSWATFSFLILILIIYFTPFANIKIGGKDAKPILSRWKWFSISLCTTIATGILFWGTAEPIYHLNSVPTGLGIENGSSEAAQFSMSTMFMHWTLTPYSIYTVASLLFAFSFYNLKNNFNLGALISPAFGKPIHRNALGLINVISLFALVAGMAASLGTGILTISGGLNALFDFRQSVGLNFGIMACIVVAFTISASSGLLKGIQLLSDYNIKAFIGIAFFVLIFGPIAQSFSLGIEGLGEYFTRFFERSTDVQSNIDTDWQRSWTVFYWANWLAWTPVTALFLGRISLGYTVRQFIHFNLFFPALFSALWMVIFSGTAIAFDQNMFPGLLQEVLQNEGAQSVIYAIFDKLPWTGVISIFFLFIVFISFVTAADSNTSALSSISSYNVSQENAEGASITKILWGLIIGFVAFIMISYSGIDGIKMLSTIGGFPILFFMILVAFGLGRLAFSRKYRERISQI
ncbi:BCCT family transporter [Neolewinella lacunae]|uniref:BCCT family transporter n=1 Tax=Neolewinella lacunae TaxID=1517758 RepID=A0A923PGS0_9BACT|nr:BCCT family transporter [Neolewinella lacunae]MBC6993765.1 BCCT family transporter [Neolewinella lacunae]MDN3636143.1 BCCT family transporter [Neolewinella lacunae]